MDGTCAGDVMQDVDMVELGVRPWNAIDEVKDMNDVMSDYFGKEKTIDFTVFSADIQLFNHKEKLTTDDEDSAMASDDYDIDPETGEKIFRQTPVAASVSLSSPSSNNKWIEEYLSNIESSSNQTLPGTTASSQSEFNFEGIPFTLFEDTPDQTDTDWLASLIDLDENSASIMFGDPAISNQSFDHSEDQSNQLTTTSPILLSSSNENPSQSVLFDGSFDDEYSTSSGSNNGHRDLHLYPSSQSGDDLTLLETKLEKLERDDNSMSGMIMRRNSTRSVSQAQQDEEALRRLNIPLTLVDITRSSTEDYNRHLMHLSHLSTEQIHLIKDIRRRGKNKIAAQNCRKRKAITVESLSEEVDELKRAKHELEERKRLLQQQIHETRSQYEYLHRQVLPDRQLPPAISVK